MSQICWRGSMPAAIDFETTGLSAGFHEIVQVAIQPLTDDLLLHPVYPPFYEFVKPNHPERANKEAMAVNGLDLDWIVANAPDSETVIGWLQSWWNRLNLVAPAKLIPICHNWPFENSYLDAWLGVMHKETLFDYHYRDTAAVCGYLRDRRLAGLIENEVKLSLVPLCKYFDVPLEKAHDALADARACAELYRVLVMN